MRPAACSVMPKTATSTKSRMPSVLAAPPVLEGGQSALDADGDRADLAAAQNGGRDEEAQRVDEDDDRPRHDAAERQRDDDGPEGAPEAGAETGCSQNQRPVDIPHGGIGRQHEKRQHVMHHADQRAGVVVDERQRLADQAHVDERAVDQPVALQQDQPGIGAHQDRRPQGQHHQHQQPVGDLVRDAGQRKAQRNAKHDAERQCAERQLQRDEHGGVGRGGGQHPPVVFQRGVAAQRQEGLPQQPE